MNRALKIAVAFAAGAAAMYYFDPIAGRRRRALARDKRDAALHDLEDYAETGAKHASDRVRGAMARARGAMSHEPLDDDRLHARIRTRLGRLVEQPGQIDVQVRDGHVALTGFAQAYEIDEVAAAVEAMRGVVDVDNRLVVETQASEAAGTGEQEARH